MVNIVLDRDNEVIVDKHFPGQVDVRANNVTMLGCTVDPNFDELYGIRANYIDPETNEVYKNFVLDGQCRGWIRGASKGILCARTRIYGTLIYQCLADGVFMSPPGNVLVAGCEFRELGLGQIGSHSDGVQIEAGSGFVIRGCTFRLPNLATNFSNSCIFIESQLGPISRIIIDRNVLDGGLYSVWVTPGSAGVPEDVTISKNTFYRHEFAPLAIVPPARVTLIENVFLEGPAPGPIIPPGPPNPMVYEPPGE